MREQNSPPNPPDLISPISGTTFTITQGETIDVDLTATATDPDGDEMIYRFWDENNADDSIGTCFDMYSGDEGTITWENLGPGTYRWYAKAADYKSGFSEKSNTNTFTIQTEDTDEYTLTVNKQGQGTITKNPDKNKYISGEQVTITANPATGWSFSQWNGDLSGSNNPKTITMDADKTVTAIFSENSNPNNPPDMPSNPTPITNSENIPMEITLNWDGGDPDGDAVTYDLYISSYQDPQFLPPYVTSLTSSEFSIELCVDSYYWWQIVATDTHGKQTIGPIWEFTTIPIDQAISADNSPPNKPATPIISKINFHVGETCDYTTSAV